MYLSQFWHLSLPPFRIHIDICLSLRRVDYLYSLL